MEIIKLRRIGSYKLIIASLEQQVEISITCVTSLHVFNQSFHWWSRNSRTGRNLPDLEYSHWRHLTDIPLHYLKAMLLSWHLICSPSTTYNLERNKTLQTSFASRIHMQSMRSHQWRWQNLFLTCVVTFNGPQTSECTSTNFFVALTAPSKGKDCLCILPIT